MRLYIDTNVIIDYLLMRRAPDFFFRLLSHNHTLIISTVTVCELRFQNALKDASALLRHYNTELVVEMPSDKFLAKQLKTHYNDALHIVIAARTKCDYIITSNIKDFTESKIPVRRPNEKL